MLVIGNFTFSITLFFLGKFNIKGIDYLKLGLNEIVYRSSFIASIPEKYLSYSFNNKTLFNNLNLKIKSNQIYGVNGSSGSGKTTLFNLLIGFLEPKKGNIYIDGKKLQ